MSATTTKVCTGCGLDKSPSEFYVQRGKLMSRCKDCKTAYQRELSRRDPEGMRAKDRAGKARNRARHREAIRARRKAAHDPAKDRAKNKEASP